MNGQEQDPNAEEAGAEDNLLHLDPNDPTFEFASEWKDDQEYNVNLKVRQISPGEFEVISGEEGDAVEGEGENAGGGGDSAETGEAAAPGANGRNPAIREAIARRYSK